jgi:hypothetical protein
MPTINQQHGSKRRRVDGYVRLFHGLLDEDPRVERRDGFRGSENTSGLEVSTDCVRCAACEYCLYLRQRCHVGAPQHEADVWVRHELATGVDDMGEACLSDFDP